MPTEQSVDKKKQQVIIFYQKGDKTPVGRRSVHSLRPDAGLVINVPSCSAEYAGSRGSV